MKKEFRVKESSEIEQILKHKKSVGNSYFAIYKKENHDAIHFRFAVSVSKKFGGAVARNLLKRRVRAIVQANRFVSAIDFFIIVKPIAKNLDFEQMKLELEKLFARAKILEG